MFKVCRVCFERQPVNNYTRNLSTKDGLSTMCKTCGCVYRKMLEERKIRESKLEIKPFVIMKEGCTVRFD